MHIAYEEILVSATLNYKKDKIESGICLPLTEGGWKGVHWGRKKHNFDIYFLLLYSILADYLYMFYVIHIYVNL